MIGKHGPVPEPVDEPSGGGGVGDAGGEHFEVGDAVPAQMVHQCGPAVGGVAGAEAVAGCQVVVEPAGQVGAGPAAGEPVLVEVGGELVDQVQPFQRDGAGGDLVGAFHHRAACRRRWLRGLPSVADHALDGEYGIVVEVDVVQLRLVVRPVLGGRVHGSGSGSTRSARSGSGAGSASTTWRPAWLVQSVGQIVGWLLVGFVVGLVVVVGVGVGR